MNTKARNKKVWETPRIDVMSIKRDTFAGTGVEIEKGAGGGQGSKKPG